MVRLVLRPYTQIRRSICTSEPLRTSIRVSSDFVLFRHSSPSFGSQSVRSDSTTEQVLVMGRCCAPLVETNKAHTTDTEVSHFHYAFDFQQPMTCVHLKLLGPCFKTGQIGDRLNTEFEVEQRRQTTKDMNAKRMHRTNTSSIAQRHHEIPTSFYDQAHPPSRRLGFQSENRSSRRLSNGEFDRFGALCTQMHQFLRRKNRQKTLQNFTPKIRPKIQLNTHWIRRLYPLPL